MSDEVQFELFGELDKNLPLSEKLVAMHTALRNRYAFLHRISVVVYDAATDMLSTYISSSDHPELLKTYQYKLAEATSLVSILQTGKPRITGDLSVFSHSEKYHTKRLLEAGYRSSYTIPMFYKDEFYGFVFFNSYETACFTPEVLAHLDPIASVIALNVILEIRSISTLKASVKTARHITSQRDCETGAHLERMSRYARLIARSLASEYQLSDAYIEQLFLFSPLHDIGKIAIPDRILLKPGTLTEEEFGVMKTHTTKGLEMIDFMLEVFGYKDIPNIVVLRNIVNHHHESFDGSGYPAGLVGEDIPFEARIIATADIFDALTSVRPYKGAWSSEKAFEELHRLAGKKLDRKCVTALDSNRTELEAIKTQFRESVYG
ncbi:MAG: HD domain-containing protein [Burkholderiales bacterium]|nr:HD domain-containing protein [Burkholderiales bacterium]